MNKVELADFYHDRGYGCAQAVLCAFREDFGLDEETALRITTGFGSGMGRLCQMCGALTGGYMVLGLKFGKVITDGSKYGTETETTYRKVAELARQFEAINGSTCCRELTGLDLSDSEQRARAVSEGIFKNSCGKYIRDAVGLLEGLLVE